MVQKKDIRILLDRRKEILEEINKLDKEYTAIGNILEELIRIEKKKRIMIDEYF